MEAACVQKLGTYASIEHGQHRNSKVDNQTHVLSARRAVERLRNIETMSSELELSQRLASPISPQLTFQSIKDELTNE